MSVLDRFSRRRPKYTPDTAFRITESGKQYLTEKFNGDPRSRILVALESGASDRDELINSTHLPGSAIERHLEILAKNGYIVPSGAGSVGEVM